MSNTADFTQGSILKKLCRFMLPVLGALILQAAYGAVDLLVVGRFGSTSGLSAVSTGSQVLNLVTFVVTQLAMGVTVLIARYIGEKREKEIGAVLGGAAVVFTILAGCLFVLLVLFARPISVLMQAPQEALALTTSYVRICGCGILFIVAYNVLSAVFRGLGDSRSPLLFVLVACLVNVAGDLVLVAGLRLDAAGAALATVLAQAVSVVCALAILRRKKLPFTFRKSDVRLNEQCRRFLAIGLPLALQEFLTQLSFLALCAFVNRLGLRRREQDRQLCHARAECTDAVDGVVRCAEYRRRQRKAREKVHAYRHRGGRGVRHRDVRARAAEGRRSGRSVFDRCGGRAQGL